MEIFLLFATSGSGWQSLRRPWQFPRRESSFPSSTQFPPTASSYHSGSLGFWVLALVLQKWSSVLQALSFLLLHLGGQEPECSKPRAFSPCSSHRFPEVQGGPQNRLFLPSLPCSASFRICPAQPTGPNQTAQRCLLNSEGEQIQCQITGFKFTRSVVSNSLQLHGLQHVRLPCPSPTLGACSNSCPKNVDAIQSSSVVPFSCPQSFPASASFPMSQFFASSGQSIGASVSASVLPVNIQD